MSVLATGKGRKMTGNLPPSSEGRDRIDLRIDPAIRERIDVQAERFNTHISTYIREAVIRRLEVDEASHPPQTRKSARD